MKAELYVDKKTAKTIYQEVAAIISNHTTSGASNAYGVSFGFCV